MRANLLDFRDGKFRLAASDLPASRLARKREEQE